VPFRFARANKEPGTYWVLEEHGAFATQRVALGAEEKQLIVPVLLAVKDRQDLHT
jgi:hypothetical protein